MNYNRIFEILYKYMTDRLSYGEKEELSQWLSESDQNAALFHRLNDKDWIKKDLESYLRSEDDAWEKISKKIDEGRKKNKTKIELDYKNEVIKTYTQEKEENRQEPKIISDIKVINRTLLSVVKENPSSVY